MQPNLNQAEQNINVWTKTKNQEKKLKNKKEKHEQQKKRNKIKANCIVRMYIESHKTKKKKLEISSRFKYKPPGLKTLNYRSDLIRVLKNSHIVQKWLQAKSAYNQNPNSIPRDSLEPQVWPCLNSTGIPGWSKFK